MALRVNEQKTPGKGIINVFKKVAGITLSMTTLFGAAACSTGNVQQTPVDTQKDTPTKPTQVTVQTSSQNQQVDWGTADTYEQSNTEAYFKTTKASFSQDKENITPEAISAFTKELNVFVQHANGDLAENGEASEVAVKNRDIISLANDINNLIGTGSIAAKNQASKDGISDTLSTISEAYKVCRAIKLQAINTTLKEGDTMELQAVCTPVNANVKYVFTSSNVAVASIDSNGKITAHKEGQTKITVTDKNTGVSTVAYVKVEAAQQLGESSKQETSNQETSNQETSNQETSNQETSKQEESSKQESSKQEESSMQEASQQESSHQESSKQESSNPTLTPTVTITKITLDASSITLTEGGSQELNAYVYFSDGSRTYQGISWQSSNTAIATVNNSGVVTANKNGTATITAAYTYKSQTYKQSCKVTVNAKPQEQVTVSTISISNSSVTLTEGGTQTISAYAVMSNGSTKSVSWQSSNQSIASISNGTITAKSAGTATITASYGGKSASCQVTVKKKEQVAQATVQYIDITDSSITIDAKKTYTLTVNAVMSDGSTKRLTNGEVLWEVVDTSIATVSNGVITGVSGGQTTVFATYKGNKVDKCTIYVNATYQQPQHPEWVPSDHYKVYSSGGYEMYEVPELTEYLNKYRRQVGASDLRWCGPDRSAANIKACEAWYNSLSDSDKAVYQCSCPEAFSEDGKIDVLKFMWSMTCESVCDSVEYCIVHRTLAHGNDYGSTCSNINSGQGFYYDPEAWVLHISESAPHWGIAMNKDADTVYAVCYRHPAGDFLLCMFIS